MIKKRVTPFRKKVQIGLYFLLLCVILTAVPIHSELSERVERITGADVLLIDPGHGGMDGGAESAGGVPEKDINLAISKELQQMAEADGWRVVMTREEDEGLYTEGNRTIRSMKTEDLKARKEIIDKTKPLVTVSIHLNSFKEDRSVHGAQVFYPSGSEKEDIYAQCKNLAELIQEEIKTGIADGTDRVALGKSGVMILKNPQTPIAIVECGFLSNYNEAELLQSPEYQRKLAGCIYSGIMRFTGREAQKNAPMVDSLGVEQGLK